jgi:hypothetical protein
MGEQMPLMLFSHPYDEQQLEILHHPRKSTHSQNILPVNILGNTPIYLLQSDQT